MRATSPLLGLIVTLAVLLLVLVSAATFAHGSIAFSHESVCGASVYVIKVDMNDPALRVDIGLPAKGIAHSETFASLVKRHAPLAAVTGIYFDVRTLRPTGTIVTRGRTVHVSHIGTAVCFMPDNTVLFVDARPGQACDLSAAECGFRTGPRLLADGRYVLNPRPEGFRHPGLFGARIRTALGVTSHNKLLLVLVRTPVSFSKLASVMKALGATDAVSLDGGTSAAMYYMGAIIKNPGRPLTNVVEIVRRTRFDMANGAGILTSYRLRAKPNEPIAGAVQAGGVVIAVFTAQQQQPAAIGSGEATSVALEVGCEPAAVLADQIRLRPCRYPHRPSSAKTA